MPISLPVFESVSLAWQKVSGSKSTFWAGIGIMFLINLIIMGIDISTHDKDHHWIITGLGLIILIICIEIILRVLSYIFSWGLLYLALKRAHDEPIAFHMIKYVFDWGIFFRMIGLYILMTTLFLIPFFIYLLPLAIPSQMPAAHFLTAVCFVTGILILLYLMARLFLATALVFLKRQNPIMAIKTSFKATESNGWNIVGLFLVNLLIILVSIIPLGIGLIWSIPYVLINRGIVYKKLITERPDL